MISRLRLIRECDFHPVRVGVRGALYPCMALRSIVENKMAPKSIFTMAGDLDYRLVWLGEMRLGLRSGA